MQGSRMKRPVENIQIHYEDNQKRLHSSLGYLSPNEFEQMLSENQNSIRSCQITLT
jgi:hypothetical protein